MNTLCKIVRRKHTSNFHQSDIILKYKNNKLTTSRVTTIPALPYVYQARNHYSDHAHNQCTRSSFIPRLPAAMATQEGNGLRRI